MIPSKIECRDFTMTFENGWIRDIRYKGIEVLRGVACLVRGERWNTVPAKFEFVSSHNEGEDLNYTFELDCDEAPVIFKSRLQLTIKPDGFIYDLVGEAKSNFLKCRIGFIVLHGEQCAGLPISVGTTEGERIDSHFPADISPHQPFYFVNEIGHSPAPGLDVTVSMAGEPFEMEDQRNWTDASFKTYCTPQVWGSPLPIQAGDVVRQLVTLQVQESAAFQPVNNSSLANEELVWHFWPKIGLGYAFDRDQPRELKPDFLRVNVRSEADILGALNNDLPLEIGILKASRETVAALMPTIQHERIERVLFLDWDEDLDRYDGPLKNFGYGVSSNFTEINRRRPISQTYRSLSYGLNPQVHAFENVDLMETTRIHGTTVETIRTFAGDRFISAGPVTFRNDGGPDCRQHENFGAAWCLASLASFVVGKVDAVSYFNETGPTGLRPSSESKTPLFRLFEFLLALKPEKAAVVKLNDNEVIALHLKGPSGTATVYANLTPRTLNFVLQNGKALSLEAYEVIW